MSSHKSNGDHLKKHLINAILEAPKISLLDAVNIKLALNQSSIPKLAKELNVSRQAVHLVIKEKAKSRRITGAIIKALGFDPWT
jgi:ABC-type uncharacterized transport system ATPase subunit